MYEQTEPNKIKIIEQEGGDKNWSCYTWHSSLVLPREYLDEARRTMDARTYAQEFEAEILSYEGALYYTFDHTINVDEQKAKRDPLEPIWLTADFNKSPMVWEVAQTYYEQNKLAIKFIDEVSSPYNAKTKKTAKMFIDRFKSHKHKTVYLTGDASSNYESWRDWTTDYVIIRDELKDAGWKVIMRVPKGNPSINNRINVVCSLLESAEGRVRMYFNPKCKLAINDMERNESDGKGGKDKTDEQQTHGSDCVDYVVWQLFAKEFYKSEVRQL